MNGKKYSGTKKLYYTINPKAPSNVKAVLDGGYDDVKVTWSPCAEADGYNIYYKKTGDSEYKKLTSTTKTSYSKKNLTDGKKYTFKVVPYFTWGKKKIESCNFRTSVVYTLKKMKAPVVKKAAKNSVKISWEDVSGESGYQISKAFRSGDTMIVFDGSEISTVQKTAAKKTYYYKVRSYKKINGKTLYGPWSEPLKYQLK